VTRLALTLTLCLVALFLVALTLGPAPIGPVESLRALITGDAGPLTLVMREIRLPRAILAVMIGASLGLAGAAMQGYLRNPLAEPGLIGVSGSAALGAVIAIQTGLAGAVALGLPAMALAGALIGVGLVVALAGPRGTSLTLILAGIAISALAAALTSLVLNLSPNPFAANEIVFWMMGSLADRSMTHVWIALPFMALGWVCARHARPRPRRADPGRGRGPGAMGIGLTRLRLTLILGTASVVGRPRRSRAPSASSVWSCHISCAPSSAHGPRGCSGPRRLAARSWCWPPTSRCA
jgi:iron complex transport system permease protein